MSRNDAVVLIRLPQSLKERIQASAESESRSMSNAIRLTLEKAYPHAEAGK